MLNNFATYLIAASGIQLSFCFWTKYNNARIALAFLSFGYFLISFSASSKISFENSKDSGCMFDIFLIITDLPLQKLDPGNLEQQEHLPTYDLSINNPWLVNGKILELLFYICKVYYYHLKLNKLQIHL